MKYTLQEIQDARSDSSDLELKRAHEIFFDLKKMVESGKTLALHEVDHFCDFEFIGTRKGIAEYDIHKYDICKDYWFAHAYREYWDDLWGLRKHTDALTSKELSKNNIRNEISRLKQIGSEWEQIIQQTTHTDQRLADIAKETRTEIKNHKKLPEFNEYGFFRACNMYKYQKMIIILRSKYIYILTREFFHNHGTDSLTLTIGTRDIEFTPYSLIHVLSRHYEFSRKQVDRQKSFHTELIEPREIFNHLRVIFSAIEPELELKLDPRKLFVNIGGQIFTIWISPATKQVRGLGNVPYERIGSFYPTEDKRELTEVNNDYNSEPHNISDQIAIYYK